MHTTNYANTFIVIAEDTVAEHGVAPPEKTEDPSIASRTWRMILEHPYRCTSDDVIFTVWADRKGIPADERDAARRQFFSKGQPCLRASDLGKKYGWGIHHDAEGRVAVYGVESDEYRALTDRSDITVVNAMRSSRR
jgi:Family of unknown function (DUF6157)